MLPFTLTRLKTMKQRLITPAVFAIALSFSLYGCASSSETTAVGDTSTTMSETQVMAGETEEMEEADAAVVLSVENREPIEDMFDKVADTKQFDLIALAKTSPNLSTFAALAEAAGIPKALKADQKYTIFAPTNEAFSSLSAAELNRLLLPENKADLIKVLQLHILPNEVTSSRFTDNQRIKAGEDEFINVELNKDTRALSIGGATVVRPDVYASNGVLHVVDGLVTTTVGTAR